MPAPKFFSPYRLDPVNQCVWRENSRVPMPPKVFDVLRHLVENSGRLVSQQELLDAVWPESFVQPEILRKYILEIRKALNDPPDKPVFIETVPKRGYRFIAPVQDDLSAPAVPMQADSASAFIGREVSLAELKQSLARALDGERQMIFVTGEGGIGKTALIDEFERQSLAPAAIRVARGQCVEGFGGKESYYPILEAFSQLMEGPRGESVVKMLSTHAPSFLVQFPAAIPADQRQALQQELLGATRERMLREISEVLERISLTEPLVLILEDLQWVDVSTLDLLSALARRRRPARLMVIATYRPVDVVLSQSPLKQIKQDLLVHRLCQELSLDPLTEAHVEQFLAAEFPGAGLPPSLASALHRRSDGNPMFILALIKQVRQQGLLAFDDGRWSLTIPADRFDPGVPQTLRQLLEIHMEALSRDERRLLSSASVAGRRFSAWACEAMLSRGEDEVEQVCESLVSGRQFLKRAGIIALASDRESPQYEFKHAFYRDTLYSQLSATQRRRAHLRLAESMELLSPAAVHPMAAELALHFEEAGSYTRAVHYLIVAASNARRRHANDEAIRLLRHALDLCAQLPADSAKEARLQILEQISDALYAQGEMEQSADVDRMAIDQAGQQGSVAAQVRGLTRLARVLAFGSPERCVAVCERAADLSRQQEDPVLRARAEMLAASWRIINRGVHKEDVQLCVAARETIRTRDVVPAYHEILYAHIQFLAGEYEDACQTAFAGIPKAVETDNLVVYLSAHSSLVGALLPLGRLGELLQILKTALDVSEKNRNAPWLSIFRANLAWVRVQCGDASSARHLADELLLDPAVEPHGQVRTMVTVTLGFADLEAGSPASAREHFEDAIRDAARGRFFLDWYWRMIAHLGLGRALLALGDCAGAWKSASVFLESSSLAGADLQALGWELHVRLALREAKYDLALEFANNALAAIRQKNVPLTALRVEQSAAECARLLGDEVRAAEHTRRAEELRERLAASLPAGEAFSESIVRA